MGEGGGVFDGKGGGYVFVRGFRLVWVREGVRGRRCCLC
jgi:hypothetical protein